MPAAHITFRMLDGEQAAAGLAELRALYSEVYAEPPYEWGTDHADLFAERFEVQRRQEGFAVIEARDGGELAGFAFGVTLQPSTPWHNLTTTLPPEVTTEHPGRTFALVELLVRVPWRRQHAAQGVHDLLLEDRPEERATLTVLPAAAPAQAAYKTAASPHGCPGPSTAPTNVRATCVRSALPANVTLSRTAAPAITAPALPRPPRPGKLAGQRVRCPKLSGQGSNRILIWKGTGSSAGKIEKIHSRV